MTLEDWQQALRTELRCDRCGVLAIRDGVEAKNDDGEVEWVCRTCAVEHDMEIME